MSTAPPATAEEAADRFRKFALSDEGREEMYAGQAVSKLLMTHVLAFGHDDKSVDLCFTVPDNLTNFFMSVHGGIVASMMDEAASICWFGYRGAYTFKATNHLSIYYHSPVRSGKMLASARICSATKSLASIDVVLKDESGKQCASARAMISLREHLVLVQY